MTAKKIATAMIREPLKASQIFQDYVMAAQSNTVQRSRFAKVQAELAKSDYTYDGMHPAYLDEVAAGRARFGEYPDALRWRGLPAGPELDVVRSNFFMAIDQQGEYENLQEALWAYADNATDTAIEQGLNVRLVHSLWDLLVKADPQTSKATNPRTVSGHVVKLKNGLMR